MISFLGQACAAAAQYENFVIMIIQDNLPANEQILPHGMH